MFSYFKFLLSLIFRFSPWKV